MRILVLAVLVTALGGCVTSQVHGPLPSYKGDDAATLYVVRHYFWVGGAGGVHVVFDGKRLGTIGSSAYWKLTVAPGEHSVGTWSGTISVPLKPYGQACVDVGFTGNGEGFVRPSKKCPPHGMKLEAESK